MAFLDGRPRTADALALSESELMIIDRRDFVPLIKSQPEIPVKLIEVLCGRPRRTSEQVEAVIFLDLPTPPAKTRLWLSKPPKPSPHGRKETIPPHENGQP